MEDQVKGNANEGVGKAKAAVGDAIGDRNLQADGVAQQGEGVLQKMVGDAKEKIDEATGAVKKALDEHTH